MLGAIVITAIGIYQLTPLKSVCLTHCRSPFDFVLNHWREGGAGAMRMSAEHELYFLAGLAGPARQRAALHLK